MTKKIIIFVVISLFAISCQSWADSERKFTKEDIKQFTTNNSFAFVDKDTIGSIFALTALRNGESSLALEMLEFQLDVIVCATWEMKDKLNEPSRNRATELLRKIKAYRKETPRKNEGNLNQEQIKAIFPGAIYSGIDYTEQAKVILAEVE